jgi:hypothetical protein
VSARHGDYGPSHVAGAIAAFHRGENVRANRTIGVLNHDRGLEEGLKGLPHIQALGLAANEHRYRLESARHLVRFLGRSRLGRFGRDSGFARSRHRIALRLQLGFGGGQLRLGLGPGRRAPKLESGFPRVVVLHERIAARPHIDAYLEVAVPHRLQRARHLPPLTGARRGGFGLRRAANRRQACTEIGLDVS